MSDLLRAGGVVHHWIRVPRNEPFEVSNSAGFLLFAVSHITTTEPLLISAPPALTRPNKITDAHGTSPGHGSSYAIETFLPTCLQAPPTVRPDSSVMIRRP